MACEPEREGRSLRRISRHAGEDTKRTRFVNGTGTTCTRCNATVRAVSDDDDLSTQQARLRYAWRLARKRDGLTRDQLAERAHLSVNTLKAYLSRNDFKQPAAERMGRVLKADPVWLLTGKGTPPDDAATGFAESGAALYAATLERPEPAAAEAEQITNLAAIADRNVRAALRAGMEGRSAEVWRLASNLIEGIGFRAGDYLVVDRKQEPAPAQTVIAILREPGAPPRALVRVILPPYLVFVTSRRVGARVEVIDDERVTLHGVVVHSVRVP